MDLGKARCVDCGEPLQIRRMSCRRCGLALEGQFDAPPLARLSPHDQVFVTAFVRHHGSIKKMESLFDVSYPTVKNRLNAITAELDRGFDVRSRNLEVLEQLERGEIDVDAALARLGKREE